MKSKKRKQSIERLWKWLEGKFREINLKLDYILFRLREEDPRIYQDDNEEAICREYDDPEFKDI